MLPIFMCMKISKEELLRINHGFGGGLRSDSSVDFAIDMQQNKKLGPYKKLAYLWRAILVDHPFTDGNKRTATYVALVFADENKKQVDRDLLLHHIVSIAKNNVIDMRQIEWRLKNAIR
jgi:prophage maintenance system killer protein